MKKKMQIAGGLVLISAFVFLWPRQRTEPVAAPTVTQQAAQIAPAEPAPKTAAPTATGANVFKFQIAGLNMAAPRPVPHHPRLPRIEAGKQQTNVQQ